MVPSSPFGCAADVLQHVRMADMMIELLRLESNHKSFSDCCSLMESKSLETFPSNPIKQTLQKIHQKFSQESVHSNINNGWIPKIAGWIYLLDNLSTRTFPVVFTGAKNGFLQVLQSSSPRPADSDREGTRSDQGILPKMGRNIEVYI